MMTRIIINGKEVTNPLARFVFISSGIIVISVVMAIAVFILLPVLGIAVTLSAGFIVVLIVSTLFSAIALAIIVSLIAWIFGAAEFRFERKYDRYK